MMTLATLMREELAAVEELRQLLQREYAALKSRDLAGLEQTCQEKQVCADRLRQLIADRLGYLREQGSAADAQSWAASVAALPATEQVDVNKLRDELEQAVEQVRAQNTVNGAVIAASRNHVERTLALLRGRDSLDFLYDHDTRKVFSGGNRPIAKA